MPATPEVDLVGGLLDDFHDFRLACHAGHIGMDVQRAEARTEGHLLRRGQGLVAEKDHLMFDQRLADRGDGIVAQRLAEVHAG